MHQKKHIDPRQTEKQIAKFKRQKCINLMEKLMKNLFRMFRDESIELPAIQKRFQTLKTKIDSLGDVPLHSAYNKAMKQYIDKLTTTLPVLQDLNSVRQTHLTHLNRIQKIKNES